MEFYDRTGTPTCYLDDDEHIYLWNGIPVGYLYEAKVYSFAGRQLGWFSDGWLYDRSNHPALFSEAATGGPIKPIRKIKPVKGIKKVRPIKSVRAVAIVRSVRSINWSDVSDFSYFEQ